jgi:hypothetical protein
MRPTPSARRRATACSYRPLLLPVAAEGWCLAAVGVPIIERTRLTVPGLLRRHGYATACIGKWHLGWTWPTRDGKPPLSHDGLGNIDFTRPISDGPTTVGFDTYFGVDLPNHPPRFIENDHTRGTSIVAPMERRLQPPRPMVRLKSNIMPEPTRRAPSAILSGRPGAEPALLPLPADAPHYPVVPAPSSRAAARPAIMATSSRRWTGRWVRCRGFRGVGGRDAGHLHQRQRSEASRSTRAYDRVRKHATEHGLPAA